MFTNRQSTRRLLSLALAIATTLTSLCFQQTVEANFQTQQTPGFAKVEAAPKVSSRLKPENHGRDERVSVILELNSQPGPSLGAFLKQNSIAVRAQLKKSPVFSINLPIHKIAELASFPEVFYISPNDPVSPSGHVTATTGTDAARAATGPGCPDATTWRRTWRDP